MSLTEDSGLFRRLHRLANDMSSKCVPNGDVEDEQTDVYSSTEGGLLGFTNSPNRLDRLGRLSQRLKRLSSNFSSGGEEENLSFDEEEVPMGDTTDEGSLFSGSWPSSDRTAQLMRHLSVKREVLTKKLSGKLKASQTGQQFMRVAERIHNVSREVVELIVGDDTSVSTEFSEDEEDQVTKDIRERVEIVSKYDKGQSQPTEDWENPNLELYQITDRYGFMHEDNPNLVQEIESKQKKAKEMNREAKWLKMRSEWAKYENTVKLRSRIYKGIPDKFRSDIWRRVLGIDDVKLSGIYEQLRLRARLVSPDLKQIDVDINRTYRNHIYFRQRYDLKQQSLFHVLAAYSMYNTDVGYCQGMSQVAALLLMYFDDEDAFWALHVLMCGEKFGMHGFFVQGFPKLLRFQRHHDKILLKFLPSLRKHLDKLDISPMLVTTKWFFQCFLDRVPFTLALRLWDIYVLDGQRILTAMAYNVMKMHSKLLLRCSMEEAMQFLQDHMAFEFGYSDDEVIESLRECLERLRRGKLLDPPPPEQNEGPKSAFGTILLSPLDEVVRSVSVMDRPKRSRTLRDTRSAGNTPINRPDKHGQLAFVPRETYIGEVTSDDGKSPSNGPIRESNDSAYATVVKNQVETVVIRTPKTSPSRTIVPTDEDDNSFRIKQTSSFYDNLPITPVEFPNVPSTNTSPMEYPLNGYTKTHERIEYSKDTSGQYRTEFNIVSYEVGSNSPASPGYATIGGPNDKSVSQGNIHRRSNHITYVDVVPDEPSSSVASAVVTPGVDGDYDNVDSAGFTNLQREFDKPTGLPYRYFGQISPGGSESVTGGYSRGTSPQAKFAYDQYANEPTAAKYRHFGVDPPEQPHISPTNAHWKPNGNDSAPNHFHHDRYPGGNNYESPNKMPARFPTDLLTTTQSQLRSPSDLNGERLPSGSQSPHRTTIV